MGNVREEWAKIVLLLAIPAVVTTLVLAEASRGINSSTSFEQSFLNVTVYQVNVAYVVSKLKVNFVNNTAEAILPGTMIAETLRVISPEMPRFRFLAGGSSASFIQEGDTVTVRADGQVFSGKYAGTREGYLVIDMGGNKTAMVALAKILSIELAKSSNIPKPVTGIRVRFEGQYSGQVELTIGYLSRGLSWSSGAELETSSDMLTGKAFLTSSDNWTSTYVTLVLGEPRVVFWGPMTYKDERGIAPSSTYAIQFTGPYYSFRLKDRISISAGEEVVVSLFSGNVKTVDYHLWVGSDPRYQAQLVSALLTINLTNTLDQPIPSGVINFFSGLDWIGSDSNAYIPKGSTSTLTVGYSRDITITSTIMSAEKVESSMRYVVALTSTNYGKDKATVVLKQNLPSDAFRVSASPDPVSKGLTLVWSITLGPQESRTITFTFEVPIYR